MLAKKPDAEQKNWPADEWTERGARKHSDARQHEPGTSGERVVLDALKYRIAHKKSSPT